MQTRHLTSLLPIAALLIACGDFNSPDLGGPVQIAIQQSLTSQTTSAGTFQLSGAMSDDGTTIEELTFGGPLDRPPVPVTFKRTLTGKQGTMVISGAASLQFSSPTAATLTGSWKVDEATGRYASLAGTGTLTGSADFGATPPSGSLSYTGTVRGREAIRGWHGVLAGRPLGGGRRASRFSIAASTFSMVAVSPSTYFIMKRKIGL